MSPAEILAALDQRLGPLTRQSRVAPARHRSVRAAVEWSYDLLGPDEQRAFRSLAGFVGGFDADAAIAVAAGADARRVRTPGRQVDRRRGREPERRTRIG